MKRVMDDMTEFEGLKGTWQALVSRTRTLRCREQGRYCRESQFTSDKTQAQRNDAEK
jgi:hypothetical protein